MLLNSSMSSDTISILGLPIPKTILLFGGIALGVIIILLVVTGIVVSNLKKKHKGTTLGSDADASFEDESHAKDAEDITVIEASDVIEEAPLPAGGEEESVLSEEFSGEFVLADVVEDDTSEIFLDEVNKGTTDLGKANLESLTDEEIERFYRERAGRARSEVEVADREGACETLTEDGVLSDVKEVEEISAEEISAAEVVVEEEEVANDYEELSLEEVPSEVIDVEEEVVVEEIIDEEKDIAPIIIDLTEDDDAIVLDNDTLELETGFGVETVAESEARLKQESLDDGNVVESSVTDSVEMENVVVEESDSDVQEDEELRTERALAEEARMIEMERALEEARLSEAEKYEAQLREAEEARIREAERLAEEKRLEEEARLRAEEELARLAEERERQAEALRIAEEERRLSEEARREEADKLALEAAKALAQSKYMEEELARLSREKQEAEEAALKAIEERKKAMAYEDEFEEDPDDDVVEIAQSKYKRSFRSKLIQGSSDVKEYYSEVKNELLSYNKCRSSVAWQAENFIVGKKTLAKLALGGKTLCLFLALDPEEFDPQIFHHKNKSLSKKYTQVPMMLRIKSDLGLRKAISLIVAMMEDNGIERNLSREKEDYRRELAYRTDEELLAEGLVKLNVSAMKSVPTSEKKEEPTEAKTYRYVKPIKKADLNKPKAVPKNEEKTMEDKPKTKLGIYSLLMSGDGYIFVLKDNSGKKVFESKPYKTIISAKRGVSTFKTALSDDSNLSVNITDDRFVYAIRGGFNYISEFYEDKDLCIASLNQIKEVGLNSDIE